MRKHLNKIYWVLSVVVVATALSSLNTNTQNVLARSDKNKPYEGLKIFSEVFHNIDKNYVDEVESQKLIEGAINGMLRTLDVHSSYMNKDMYKEMQIETDGEFGGLGIEISIKDSVLTVVSPIEDTPAYRAGVKAGDKIVAVDDVPTKGMALSEAVKMMRGPKGTPVVISVMRKDLEEPLDIEIIRDIIKLKSVKHKVLDENIGYIRISNFSKSTGDDVEKALVALEKEKTAGLILDLRYNPGGLLNQAVEVAEKFLEKGSLIVYTQGRQENQNFRFNSNAKKVYNKNPIVILVNAGSASASEIVAGALQDLKKAVILGTKTFGKGSVQTIMQLTDGSGLRLTTAKYYTPSGRVIHGNGIIPDIIVEEDFSNKKDNDKKKVKFLREKDIEKHLNEKETAIKKKIKENNESSNKKTDEAIKEGRESEGEEKKNDEERVDVQLNSAISLLKGWKIFKETTITH